MKGTLIFPKLSLIFGLIANTFVPNFCFTGSSRLHLGLSDFSLSWLSRFFLSHSLKSSRVGRYHWCFTVCIDHASLRFGGSLITAWFSKLTLFRSSLKNRGLNEATSPEVLEEKPITFNELCIFRGRKLFNLSRRSPTTTCGYPIFLWRVANASLNNTPL